jgi:hypothetical protein
MACIYDFFVVMALFDVNDTVFTTGPPALAYRGFELVQT